MTPARQGKQFNLLLADEVELARQVIYRRRPEQLGHHPSGWLARHVLEGADWAESHCALSNAAMACPLREGVLDEYLEAVAAGRPVGSPNWPLPFIAH